MCKGNMHSRSYMTESDVSEYCQKMEIYIENLKCTITKEKAVQDLIEMGILLPDGKTIAEPYRIEPIE